MPEHFPLMVPSTRAAPAPGEVRSPLDQSLIATLDQVDLDGARQALATAKRLFRNRDAWLSPARRIEILRRAADLMQSRRDRLALEATREGGKPLIDSLVEADRAVDSMRLCVEHLRSQAGEEIPMGRTASSGGRLAFTQLEPIGPVLAFSAFNHPLNLIAHQVGPAVAAGCPVVVKPAKATPLSCFRLVQILREAGLPDEWCQPLVTIDHDVANQMVADPRVAFFTFIGSGEVGWRLRRQLAPGTRCSLELGGAAPVIVAADADLEYAAPLLVKGGFYHAGQVCVSVQRIFADRRIAQALAARIASAAEGLKGRRPGAFGDRGRTVNPRGRGDASQPMGAGGRAGRGRFAMRRSRFCRTIATRRPCSLIRRPTHGSCGMRFLARWSAHRRLTPWTRPLHGPMPCPMPSRRPYLRAISTRPCGPRGGWTPRP